MPEGTVCVISAENMSYSGSTPAGPLTDVSQVPGHFFASVRANNSFEFLDGQAGDMQSALPGMWIYRYMVVGNALRP